MNARGRWQGMLRIARFNWPFYVVAAMVVLGSVTGLIFATGAGVKIVSAFALAGALYFLGGSLGVSYLVYDCSDLYRWRWLHRALPGGPPQRAISCHCGFDETSAELRAHFAGTEWMVLDHFSAKQMTEASIRRARRLFPPGADTLPAEFDQWPSAAGSADAVFGLLAIHELRSVAERGAWFVEARRCLRPGGRVVLAEHVRDLANFLAFGPGFLHFHSLANWRQAWESAGLRCVEKFRVTPWVCIFVLEPRPGGFSDGRLEELELWPLLDER